MYEVIPDEPHSPHPLMIPCHDSPPPLNEVYAPLRDCMICGGELHAPLRVHIMSTPLNDGSLAWSVWVSPLPPFESMSYLRPRTVVPLHDLCWWAPCPLWVHVISTPLNGGSLAWSVWVRTINLSHNQGISHTTLQFHNCCAALYPWFQIIIKQGGTLPNILSKMNFT